MPQDTIFDEFGYITTEKLAELTYEEVQKIIMDEMKKADMAVKRKKTELQALESYLAAIQYNWRTAWLLYQDDRPPEGEF